MPVCELPEGYGANLSLSLPRLTQPRSPTTSGKIERFHGSLRREFLDDAVPFADLAAAQAAVDAWVEQYNTVRPHQALGMAVPADRFSTAHAQAEQELLPPRLPAVNLAPVPPLPGGPPQATAEQSRFAPRIAAVLWSSSGWSRPAGTCRSRPGSSGSGRPVPGMVWARLLDLAWTAWRAGIIPE